MLTKEPKSSFRRFIGVSLKAALIVEAAGLAVSYGLWYKFNTDRDFRLYMYKNHNWLLEGYYGLGEKLANHKTRDIDQVIWANEGKI